MIQPKNPNLTEITSPIQAKRGNRQFFDTQHKVSYITYANGYVRREVKASTTCMWSNKQFKVQDQFPINKRQSELKSYQDYEGKSRSYKQYKVILEPCPQKRMDMIDRISNNYKGYTGRMSTDLYNLIPR
jgi:hypothetical protein